MGKMRGEKKKHILIIFGPISVVSGQFHDNSSNSKLHIYAMIISLSESSITYICLSLLRADMESNTKNIKVDSIISLY